MKTAPVANGPNRNLLGTRAPSVDSTDTWAGIDVRCHVLAIAATALIATARPS